MLGVHRVVVGRRRGEAVHPSAANESVPSSASHRARRGSLLPSDDNIHTPAPQTHLFLYLLLGANCVAVRGRPCAVVCSSVASRFVVIAILGDLASNNAAAIEVFVNRVAIRRRVR